MTPGSMAEVIALENEIMEALQRVDVVSGADAQDVLFNAWAGRRTRLERLRVVAADLRRLAQ